MRFSKRTAFTAAAAAITLTAALAAGTIATASQHQASAGSGTGAGLAAQVTPAPSGVYTKIAAPASGRSQFCNNQAVSQCMNDWNNAGTVKTYTPGVTNNDYEFDYIYGLCKAGSDQSTAGCPITGIPAGYVIFSYYDPRTGKCIDLGPAEKTCSYTYSGQVNVQGINVPGCPTTGAWFTATNKYYSNKYGGWSHAVGYYWYGGDGSTVYQGNSGRICQIESVY
jgi:hypothetical protein